MNKTPYDKGMEVGELKALRRVALALLESRFQSVPNSIAQKLESLSPEQLQQLMLKIPSSNSIAELFDSN